MSLVFKIHRVPTDDPILTAFLSGKLSALRLQALTLSQSAFGGNFVFDIFARMPHTKWIERLQRPNFHTFVAIAYPEGTTEEEQTIDTGDIVGTATISKCKAMRCLRKESRLIDLKSDQSLRMNTCLLVLTNGWLVKMMKKASGTVRLCIAVLVCGARG